MSYFLNVIIIVAFVLKEYLNFNQAFKCLPLVKYAFTIYVMYNSLFLI